MQGAAHLRVDLGTVAQPLHELAAARQLGDQEEFARRFIGTVQADDVRVAQRAKHLELSHQVVEVVFRPGLVENLHRKVLLRLGVLHLLDLGEVAAAQRTHVTERVPELLVLLEPHRLHGATRVVGVLPSRRIGLLRRPRFKIHRLGLGGTTSCAGCTPAFPRWT